jgi:predicted ATPase
MQTLQNVAASCPYCQKTRELDKSALPKLVEMPRAQYDLQYDGSMQLTSVRYSEFRGEDSEWNLDTVNFGQINLLVGRNASGKSRIISLIANLSRLLAGKFQQALGNADFDARFSDLSHTYHYALTCENFLVDREDFDKDNINLLHRGLGGLGDIYAEEEGKKIRFRISGEALAAVAKRDSLQHPFLEPLGDWGNAFRLFEFGKSLGHRNLAVAIKSDLDLTDETDTTQIVRTFHKGKTATFADNFLATVKADMNTLGYPIVDVDIRKPANFFVLNQPATLGDLVGISVKEKDLAGWTDQLCMSQGMFRALSIIVQVNYNLFAKTAATFLIDDIGEGLDYERSFSLVKLLREKALESKTQLIMSTNDRFIMNGVPLEDWCVLRRVGHNVKAYNYSNAEAAFERFKKTGLSNFDLLTTDYIQEYVQKVSQDGENGDLRRGSDGKSFCGTVDPGNGGATERPH